MFKSVITACIAACALAYRPPTEAQRASVKEWDEIMKSYDRDYEIYTVKTDDEWKLTLFRIMPGKDAEVSKDEDRQSVLFQHGLMMDAASWFFTAQEQLKKGNHHLPAFLRMADEGYDVYMGNNRGTRYSNVNPKYPFADDVNSPQYKEQNREKYDFTPMDFGKSDLPAFLDKITDINNQKQVTYVGYSQGTTQILMGLSTLNSYFAEKLNKAILLAPCLYGHQIDMNAYQAIFPAWREEGVNAILSPNWETDLKNICEGDGREYACGFAKTLRGIQSPVASMEYFTQLGVSERFQEYTKDFSPTNIEQPLVKPGLGSITVPLQFVQAQNDEGCPAFLTKKIMDDIGDAVHRYKVIEDVGHEWFFNEVATSEFHQLLEEELAYIKISKAEVVSWAINTFVEEPHRQVVVDRIDRVQESAEHVENAFEDAEDAVEDVVEATQGLRDAVSELFMSDSALKMSAAAFTAAVAASSF